MKKTLKPETTKPQYVVTTDITCLLYTSGNMATKIHIMRKKLREMMGDLQQTQQVLESNAEDLNHLMKQKMCIRDRPYIH